jgi:hypothetical protein
MESNMRKKLSTKGPDKLAASDHQRRPGSISVAGKGKSPSRHAERRPACSAPVSKEIGIERQALADWLEEVMKSKSRCRKELKRLRASVVEQTASGDMPAPKVRYFDEKWLAARWGMSVKHVRTLRYAGDGPKVTYFGRSVRYRLRDVTAYEREHSFASRSAKDQATKAK